MQFICSVFYDIMKCYMQTTILHIHSTEVRPKAKSQVKPKPKKQQKPKAKSQESSEAKAKSQKPNGHANWLQTAANSTQIRDFGSKMQQIQARSQKPKEPEAKSQKQKKMKKKAKKIPLQSKNLFGAQNRLFARTVQKKHVKND